MKTLVLIILAFSMNVFAEQVHEEKFDKVKTAMVNRLDQKISNLSSAKACISAAHDKNDVAKCREEMKTKHKAMQAQMKEQRAARKATRSANKKIPKK